MRANQPASHLLTYLAAFEAGELTGAEEHYRATGASLPLVAALHRAILDNELFLTPSEFRWATWRADAQRYMQDVSRIAEVDLSTARKLLSYLWHQDRISGGLFPRVCANGIMQAVLQRLSVLYPGRASGGSNVAVPC